MEVADLRGQVDFGIITIREDELAAVLARFPMRGVAEAPRRRYRIRELTLQSGERYTIAAVACTEQGNTDALNTARDLLEDLAPAFLLVVGIAGSVPASEWTLGDVVVSKRIVDFSVEAVLHDQSREYALAGGPLHPEAAKLASDIAAMVHDGELAGWNDASILLPRPRVDLGVDRFYGDEDWRTTVRASIVRHFVDQPARPPRVTAGVIASSDRLIKDAETLQVWLKVARQLAAIEMESAGVYKAAHGRVPFLAIRGISDVVGFKRDPEWTAYACASAAAFARGLLLTRPVPPLAPRSSGAPTPDTGPPPVTPTPDTGPPPVTPVGTAAISDRSTSEGGALLAALVGGAYMTIYAALVLYLPTSRWMLLPAVFAIVAATVWAYRASAFYRRCASGLIGLAATGTLIPQLRLNAADATARLELSMSGSSAAFSAACIGGAIAFAVLERRAGAREQAIAGVSRTSSGRVDVGRRHKLWLIVAAFAVPFALALAVYMVMDALDSPKDAIADERPLSAPEPAMVDAAIATPEIAVALSKLDVAPGTRLSPCTETALTRRIDRATTKTLPSVEAAVRRCKSELEVNSYRRLTELIIARMGQ